MDDIEMIARAMHRAANRVCGFQPHDPDELVACPRSSFQTAVSEPKARPDLVPAWSLFVPDAEIATAQLHLVERVGI